MTEEQLVDLAKEEAQLMRLVESRRGTMEEEPAQLATFGVYRKYQEVHHTYAQLLPSDLTQEALKRALFIQWYCIVEPECLSGIRDIDLSAESLVLTHLNELLSTHQADAELLSMLRYYSSWEWVFLRAKFEHLLSLYSFVRANLSGNELPTAPPIRLADMANRGQMGAYWLSVGMAGSYKRIFPPTAPDSVPPPTLIAVIIPAYNEARSIAQVVAEIPAGLVGEVVVVDNNSSDDTAAVARAAGATVVREPRPGYGHACLAGMAHVFNKPAAEQPEIIVFLDGDHSDYPEEMPALLAPILSGAADMVIGSRALGERERGAMLPQQLLGNWLATRLLRWLYGARYTDLGPFRAIRAAALQSLNMQDRTYGWTVEMQLKAAKLGLRSVEVPVRYRRRIGVSKVSGTVKGTLGAGYKILWTIFKYR